MLSVKGSIAQVNGTVDLLTSDMGSIGVQVTGTWTGTITFEVSANEFDYQATNVVATNGTALITTTTANGVWQGSVAGMRRFRVRATAWTSGTAVVQLETDATPPGNYLGAISGAVTIADGADTNAGITTDTAVTGDNTGTLSAKIRGINKILADVWDSANGWLEVTLKTGTAAIGSVIAAGDVAHDSVNSGSPLQMGGHAVSGSASPTSVAAADRARWIFNQAGVPYTIAGHPNLITREFDFGAVAQTDLNLAAALVAADERVYVTRFEAMCDNANTVNVSVRAGFGTAAVPTASATGVSGMIGSHPGVAAGSGFVCGSGAGLIAVGGVGEEPRLTSSAATTGNLHVVISYYLIDETP